MPRRIAIIFDNTLRPETTGTYCLRALKKIADVEFFTPDQLDRIPRAGFDLYLSIDDGLRYRLPSDLRPCAWWVIDTHMDLAWAIERGQDFDWLFAAQHDGTAQLQAAGLPAIWLPLACDPGIHRAWPTEKQWDVCFVGRISPGPRRDLLQMIVDRFPRTFIGQRYFDEYAQTLSASQIGFNRSVKNDVNMRVFETLGCGPLLITNDLGDNAQNELLQPDQHLVTYQTPDELIDKLQFFLRVEESRRRIADAGHAEALAKHTYGHRMQTILSCIESDLNRSSVRVPVDLPFGTTSESNWLESIDFIIKTFLRPAALLRLLESIRRHFPTAHVTIADDGNLRSCRDLASIACCKLIDEQFRFELLELPFASGVTPGRNRLVEKTGRPFLLLLDDDFAFMADTDIQRFWDRLQQDSTLGVVAGACMDVIHGERQLRNSGGTLDLVGDVLEIRTQHWRDQGLGLREYVPQFALIRREVFQDVQWEGGVGGEHYDFCLQLMQSRWKVAHDLSVAIEHHPLTETLPGYADYRFDFSEAQQRLLRKWKLQRIVQDGKTIVERTPEPMTPEIPDTALGRPSKESPYFEFARPEVVALVPVTARRVLDIGCGAGRFGQLLKERQSVHVTGLELQPVAASRARQRLDQVLEQNVEETLVDFSEGSFDCVVCADVLEHLREPVAILAKIRRWLTPDGSLVISLPNVRHHSVVSGLLEGNWTYESAGLLDNDHVRFFTRREIEKLLFRQQFEITSLIPKPGPGHAEWVAAGRPGSVKAGSLRMEGLTPESAEEFFTYQYLVVARPNGHHAEVPANRNNSAAALNSLRQQFPWPNQKPVVEIPRDNLGWCSPATQSLLEQELTPSVRLVVELGSWLGLSTRFIADRVPQAHVIAVDHWQGSPEHHRRAEWAAMLPNLYETFQSLTWEYQERVTPLRMTTMLGLQKIAEVGLQPDLIFVDAEHSFEAVSAELDVCRKLFPQARLIGDDYEDPGIQRAVTEFASRCGTTVQLVGNEWRSWKIALVNSIPSPKTEFGLTSIVIVTFNQLGYTKECVDSIRLRTDEPYELIFVDNGSTDGTPEYLASLADAKVICNAQNRGFPAAVNQGLQHACGDQILLLNNDTVVSTGWLHKLLATLNSDARIGLVGPSSNNVSGSQQVLATYTEMSCMDGFAWDWGKRQSGIQEETDRLVGFCLLIRRSVVEQIGGLDEQFGIGCFEDDDICLRAIRAGWKAVIARDAFVHHYGGRTFIASGVDFAALMQSNQQKFRTKWQLVAPATSPKTPTPAFSIARAEGGGLLLNPARRPRISLCMIVRNNEHTIGPCLESIRPWVDEMIVVDTGSTDRTPEICAMLGAQVHHWPWRDDFSAARNESLKYATGEWLFWMDSDDTISVECGQQLRKLADGEHSENILGYVIQVHCPGPGKDSHDITAVDHVKLIRNRPDLRFEHRIHEQILPAIRRAGGDVQFTDIHVVHSGADHTPEGRERKLERDFKLLKLDLAERPDHPFVLFNLGMTCADVRQHTEAVDWLTRCLQVSHPNESHVRKAYALLISSLTQLRDVEQAWLMCERGRGLFPDDKELVFRQAMVAHELGRFEQAVALYRQVLAPAMERHFASVDLGLSGFKARHNLALVYESMEQQDLAEREWRTILQEKPDYHSAQIGLIENLIKRGLIAEAEHQIMRLRDNPETVIEGIRLMAHLVETNSGASEAIRLIQQGLDQFTDDTVLLRELARLSHDQHDYSRALSALERLTELLPDDASAWHNRGVILATLNRTEESQLAFARASALRNFQHKTN